MPIKFGELHGCDLTGVQVGDKVWTMQYGWTTVADIRPDHNYAIEVDEGDTYTMEGKINTDHVAPSLFLTEPTISDVPNGMRVITRYANLYANGEVGNGFDTKEEAVAAAGGLKVIETRKIEWVITGDI